MLVLSKYCPGQCCKFQDIYVTVPNPSYQPSLSPGNDGKVKTKQASSLLVPVKAWWVAQYVECKKPQVIYSETLNAFTKNPAIVTDMLEHIIFTCGSLLQDPDAHLN